MKNFVFGFLIGAVVVGGASFLMNGNKGQIPTQGVKSASTTSGESYKIGVIVPLTGEGAVYGEPLRNIVALAVEEVNKEGGVDGKKLEFIYEDGKCNGKDGANAMQKLVQVEKVQLVLGGFCSSESLAAIPIAEKNKVAMFSAGSSSPKLTGKSSYFFRDYPSDSMQGETLAKIAYNDKKWKTVAFIVEQKDYPLGIYSAFTSVFEELGGKVIKEEFAPETSDFRSQLTKLKDEGADALFIDVQNPPPADRILKQLAELGWNPPLMVSDTVVGDVEIVANNSKGLEGAIGAEFGVDLENPKLKHLVSAYKEKYGEELTKLSYGQTEYDAVFIIRDALKAVGYDGEKIAAWSRTIKDWEGASGKVTIQESGDRAGGFQAKVVKDGKVALYDGGE